VIPCRAAEWVTAAVLVVALLAFLGGLDVAIAVTGVGCWLIEGDDDRP
jgi:hypothetical protein